MTKQKCAAGCRMSMRMPVRRRRGSVLIYSFFLMTIMLAFISFGVDYGHMQMVKTELQRNADATARAALQMYVTYGSSVASSYAPYVASQAYNPVDSKSGVSPTVSINLGFVEFVEPDIHGRGVQPGGGEGDDLAYHRQRKSGEADFSADERCV